MGPRTFVTRGAALVALAAFGLLACETKTVVQPQNNPLKIAVTPAAATLTAAGQKVQFVAVVTGGEVGTSHAYTWSSSNTAVATVDANGVATAVANGTASIVATATADATVQAAALVTVDIPAPPVVEPPAPASISIASITDAGGTLLDYQGLGGQAYVHLNLDVPTGNVVKSINVALDGQTVWSQVFTSTTADASVAEAAVSEVTAQVNTMAYDTATGVATYSNGPHTLSATLVGQADTIKAQTVQSLVFANEPFIALVVTPSQQGSNGLDWVGGTVGVKATPVLYGTTALNTVTVMFSSAMMIRGAHAAAILNPSKTQTVSAPGPLNFTFSPSDLYAPSGFEGLTRVSASSQTITGRNGPTEQPEVLINLDERAPWFSTTTFQFASNASTDAAPYWLGSSALLTLKGLLGSGATETDGGVDHDVVTVYTASTDTAQFTVATTIGALGQKAAGSTVAKITICDAFQNCRSIYSPAFGVDLVPPKLTITAEHNNSINGDTVAVALLATDTGAVGTVVSGIPAGQFKTRVVEFIPGGNRCLDAGTGVDAPQPGTGCAVVPVGAAATDNYSFNLLPATEAYDSVVVTAVDSAGNSSQVGTRFYLFDTTAPTISGILPSAPTLVGGTAVSFTTGVSDNLDLRAVTGIEHFANGGMLPMDSVVLGTFGLPLETVNASAVVPDNLFITSFQSTDVTNAPRGDNSYNAVSVTLSVSDQAGQTASRTQDISANVVDQSSFNFANAPANVRTWTLTVTPASATHPASAVLSAAVVVPTGGAPPFSRIVFYEIVPGAAVRLAAVDGTAGHQDETATSRTYTYTVTTPTFTSAGVHTYVVVGIDANGHAISSQQPTFAVN